MIGNLIHKLAKNPKDLFWLNTLIITIWSVKNQSFKFFFHAKKTSNCTILLLSNLRKLQKSEYFGPDKEIFVLKIVWKKSIASLHRLTQAVQCANLRRTAGDPTWVFLNLLGAKKVKFQLKSSQLSMRANKCSSNCLCRRSAIFTHFWYSCSLFLEPSSSPPTPQKFEHRFEWRNFTS